MSTTRIETPPDLTNVPLSAMPIQKVGRRWIFLRFALGGRRVYTVGNHFGSVGFWHLDEALDYAKRGVE